MADNNLKQQIADLPDTPGVYFFRHGKEILYIGKATSLHDRVRSYFTGDLMESRGPKIVKMLEIVNSVTYEQTDSVLEALILESNLIKKHQPEYNTREKDGKSFNYIVITKEDFPRIFTIRERELRINPTSLQGYPIDEVFGPYPHGGQLQVALKIIRKIFPFRDKKARQTHHERFYRQIRLSPDLSDTEAKQEYKNTVKNIKLFLKGEKKTLLKKLERDMMTAAKAEKFERANEIKKTVFALQHIQDIALIKDDLVEKKGKVIRIEAYDVAHTSGQNTVGVMTVITDGEPDVSQYRKFKMRAETRGSDTHALAELLERRFQHDEWRLPRLIVIDGGLAQKRVAERVLRSFGYEIPVVSVVKNEKHKPKNILGQKGLISEYESEILHANAEAHRFAIQYHKQLRRKGLK